MHAMTPKNTTANTTAKVTAKTKAAVKAKNKRAATKALTPHGLRPALDPLRQYMQEVRRYPVLSREEELEWAKIYFNTKNPEAAHKLVTSNLRFVIKMAMQYAHLEANVIDLIQEGNVGLMRAVKEFNPYKGTRLITYASLWIRGQIQDYLLRQFSMVKVARTPEQKRLFYQLQKESQDLSALGLQEVKQLSGKLMAKDQDIKVMSARIAGRDISLEAPRFSGDDDSSPALQERVVCSASVDPLQNLEKKLRVSSIVSNMPRIRARLSKRELYVLDHRLLSDAPESLQKIGNHYGITREAVRQMEARLLKKLKNLLER